MRCVSKTVYLPRPSFWLFHISKLVSWRTAHPDYTSSNITNKKDTSPEGYWMIEILKNINMRYIIMKNPSQTWKPHCPPFHYLFAIFSTSCHGQELFDHRDFQGFEQDLRGSSVFGLEPGQLMGTMGPRNPSWGEHVWRDGWVKLFVLVGAKRRYHWRVTKAGKSQGY